MAVPDAMMFCVELYRGCAGCDDVSCRAVPWLAVLGAMMNCVELYRD